MRRRLGAPEPQNVITTDSADYEANIQSFIDEDYDVIVTVGFALGEATLAAATANPDVHFIGVDQFQAGDDFIAGAGLAELREPDLQRGAGGLPGRHRRRQHQRVRRDRRDRRLRHDPAGRQLHARLREWRAQRQSRDINVHAQVHQR